MRPRPTSSPSLTIASPQSFKASPNHESRIPCTKPLNADPRSLIALNKYSILGPIPCPNPRPSKGPNNIPIGPKNAPTNAPNPAPPVLQSCLLRAPFLPDRAVVMILGMSPRISTTAESPGIPLAARPRVPSVPNLPFLLYFAQFAIALFLKPLSIPPDIAFP